MKFAIVVFLALVVIIAASQYEEDAYACDDRCKDDSYDPVCAVDKSGRRRTFTNDCKLVQFNCKSSMKWRKTLNKKCG